MYLDFDERRERDVIAFGRATIDLYANETAPLEDAVTFTKYVGGSPANTSVSMANLGLKVGYIGKVSDDGFGRFIVRYLSGKGVDTSHIRVDGHGARSGVTIGEIRSQGECSYLMYRHDVADLHIRPDELDEEYIASSKALLISGTSLSHSPAREAVFHAMELARRGGTRIVFDLDWREGTWNSAEEAAVYYTLAAQQADMVVATREEFDVLEALLAPGNRDDTTTAQRLLERGVQLVSVKKGKQGSTVYLRDGRVFQGVTYPAEVVKTFGAGDAYAGAFLYGLLRGFEMDRALRWAAASASITIGGHSCSDSTPTRVEIEQFLERLGESK